MNTVHDISTNKSCLFVSFLALKSEPTNVNILWDRAALSYQMENPKKALEYYEIARQVN